MKKHFLLATIAIISNAAIAQSPDLRPIWDSYPTQSTPGSTIGLDVRVKNYGTVTASSSSLQYRLEDGQGTLIAILGTDGVSSLSPGSESDENITITLPSVVDPCGEFFFVAVADHLNEVNEGIFENNNSSAVQVQLAPADADLNPSFETCPLTTTSGANISSSLNIFNNGTGPSGGASILKFYWHSSPNISGATLVSTESIPNINANDVENDAYSIPVPSNLQAGTYYLIAEVDADHDICETNESNNISLCTIQIQGPDLKPIWSNVPSNAYAGAIINVDVTVHNLGPVSSSNSCTLKYYWSDDPTWNVSDQELGYDIVSSISAYDTEDESATLTLPQSTNGSHYLIAKVDVLENVLETNEFNNETSTLITIGDPPSVCEYKEQMQNWDWRSENYEFYTVQQGVLNVPSPWTSNNFGDQTQYFIQTPTKDFQPSDGWVLIQKDFGTSTAPISNPYFILYNKYSAILRAFVALSDNEINLGNDKVGVSLAFGDGSQRTALLEHYTDSKGRNPLFEFNNNIDELIISNDFGSAQPYYWQHADFLMNYDPCTCKSNGYLELKTRKIEPSQLTFNHIYNLPYLG